MNPTELKNIIESLLFVTDTPLSPSAVKKVVTDSDIGEIRQALAELKAEYEARQGGFVLSEVADGYQFRTRSAYKEWIKRMFKPPPTRLGKAALETLAIIAYHQPVIRADVEKIRGVDSGAILRTLLERKLIRILGKKEIPGRPLIYATTQRFLEVFNLRSLRDMPTLKEIQDFARSDDDEMDPPLVETDVAEFEEPTPDSTNNEMTESDTPTDEAPADETSADEAPSPDDTLSDAPTEEDTPADYGSAAPDREAGTPESADEAEEAAQMPAAAPEDGKNEPPDSTPTGEKENSDFENDA
ncbi:SMC-Scp complex subunit ScpB [Desulfosudis oleivorans]|uniref:Segregation and condensation protein B n=1 Tax=Desulfosudis oleivorans (strain DSM 6200 / JCM 39069 / Hxd3) TaxID=96561 RepID=A8ZXT5_DESOH|nr:SMC-Scp complex subunit ScpB [Desulfosudis oleivorans]ABW68562.1 segregation and condensation protein B [Desulfosudis oleivorans Hxd3]